MANLNKNAVTKSFVFAGGGAFYLANVDGQGNRLDDFVPMGVVDSASLTIEATNIEKYDPSSGLNELFSRLTVQQSATMTFTVSEISYAKIAEFLFGTYSEIASEAITAEAYTVANVDSLLAFGKLIDESVAVVVDDADSAVTYVEGVNYDLDASGIYIFSVEEQTARGATTDKIEVGTNLEIDYTAKAMEKIDGFTQTSNRKAVYFQGASLDDNQEWIFEGYKLSFEPLSALPFISVEDYATYELTATLEKVSGRTSSFFELKKSA